MLAWYGFYEEDKKVKHASFAFGRLTLMRMLFGNFRTLDLKKRREALDTFVAADISPVTHLDDEDVFLPAISTAARGILVAPLRLQARLLVEKEKSDRAEHFERASQITLKDIEDPEEN